MHTLPTTIHIAILDDHRLFRQGISYILHSLPFVARVSEAATFGELQPQLAQELPDILLLDMQMPEMDGMEVAKHLLQAYPELKIIVLSMHSDDHFIVPMFRLGVRSYLPKDVDKEQLRTAIAAVMTEGYYFTAGTSKSMMRGLGPGKQGIPAFQSPPIVLTPREADVLTLVCKGCSTSEIAQQLFISNRTVEGHRQNLLEKTNTPNAVSLALYAVKHGLCSAGE